MAYYHRLRTRQRAAWLHQLRTAQKANAAYPSMRIDRARDQNLGRGALACRQVVGCAEVVAAGSASERRHIEKEVGG